MNTQFEAFNRLQSGDNHLQKGTLDFDPYLGLLWLSHVFSKLAGPLSVKVSALVSKWNLSAQERTRHMSTGSDLVSSVTQMAPPADLQWPCLVVVTLSEFWPEAGGNLLGSARFDQFLCTRQPVMISFRMLYKLKKGPSCHGRSYFFIYVYVYICVCLMMYWSDILQLYVLREVFCTQVPGLPKLVPGLAPQ